MERILQKNLFNPMLSIIIITYNEEKYLPKLLHSIKNQSFRDYEVIVADAKSTDKTREIARKFGCRIINGGMPSAGRNNGAKAAKGNTLFFFDADSILPNDFLMDSLDEINERGIDVAGVTLKPLGDNIMDKFLLFIFNSWSFLTQLLYPHATGSGIFCRKWLHDKVKGFDEKLVLGEDMDYVKRCSKLGKFRILKKPKLYFSMRRYEKEGRLKTGLKILISEFYRILFGEIKSDLFKYKLKYKK